MEINYSQFVFKEGDLTKYLKYPKKLGICYDTNLPESFISFPEGEVYFEENGYFDPLAIVWEGEMGKQRIADWLPYEYSYK